MQLADRGGHSREPMRNCETFRLWNQHWRQFFCWCGTGLLLIGCLIPHAGPEVTFVAFDEPQQTWPTRKWGFLHLVDGFPIYALDQLPPEPYEVLGIASVTGRTAAD